MLSIALLNPLGDYGVNQYCHELARGLGMNGARVAFYTGSERSLPAAQYYERFSVLNNPLFKQRDRLNPHNATQVFSDDRADDNWAAAATVLSVREKLSQPVDQYPNRWYRQWFLSAELAVHLRASGYQVVWTHWPTMDAYAPWFWRACRHLGLYVVHTIHNVKPHEENPVEKIYADRIYRDSHLLFVHSRFAQQELLCLEPQLAGKVEVYLFGMYSIYPRRPGARDRIREQLNISKDQIAVLFCGGVRPYKNIDTLLTALQDRRTDPAVLVVAGVESHYPDLVPGDPLGRTRRLAAQLGITDRVRLLPRPLSIVELAELFEAGDINALPYTEGYGSGMLLLGMTFGKYILSTRTGGADEYLEKYSPATLLEGSQASDIARGMELAIDAVRKSVGEAKPIASLQWPVIAQHLLSLLQTRMPLNHRAPKPRPAMRDGSASS